jgi:hypothetical protein
MVVRVILLPWAVGLFEGANDMASAYFVVQNTYILGPDDKSVCKAEGDLQADVACGDGPGTLPLRVAR